jgi:hypothetical protein
MVELAAVAGLLAEIQLRVVSVLTAGCIVGLMVGAIGYHLRARGGVLKLLGAAATATMALALVSAAF